MYINLFCWCFEVLTLQTAFKKAAVIFLLKQQFVISYSWLITYCIKISDDPGKTQSQYFKTQEWDLAIIYVLCYLCHWLPGTIYFCFCLHYRTHTWIKSRFCPLLVFLVTFECVTNNTAFPISKLVVSNCAHTSVLCMCTSKIKSQ